MRQVNDECGSARTVYSFKILNKISFYGDRVVFVFSNGSTTSFHTCMSSMRPIPYLYLLSRSFRLTRYTDWFGNEPVSRPTLFGYH